MERIGIIGGNEVDKFDGCEKDIGYKEQRKRQIVLSEHIGTIKKVSKRSHLGGVVVEEQNKMIENDEGGSSMKNQ